MHSGKAGVWSEKELSIVHKGSYGGKQGLFEIGVFPMANLLKWMVLLQTGDTVKGFH